jgi:hypothetical protein
MFMSNYFWAIWYDLKNKNLKFWWYLCFIQNEFRDQGVGIEMGITIF